MNQFSDRHQVQEYLTSQIKEGAIVELGCGYGNGVIAMCKGNLNNLEIYSIDPYFPYSDPLGGKYDERTYQEMLINTQGLPFTHIRQSALEVEWTLDIGLLWVDLSMPFQELWSIVYTWQKWILPGGYLGITGLEYSQLGTREVMEAMESHYDRVLEEQNLVAVLRKR